MFGIVGTHPSYSGPMTWGHWLNCSNVKHGLKETPEGTSLESRSLCCGVMSAPELLLCKGVSEHSILWGTELSLACFMTGQRNAEMDNSALLSCFLLSYLFLCVFWFYHTVVPALTLGVRGELNRMVCSYHICPD